MLIPKSVDAGNNYEKILCYIRQNPSTHLRQIANNLNMSLGTVRYHLEVLEKKGKVIFEKNTFYKYYFSIDTFPENERKTLKILHHETTREILLYLMENNHAHQNEIAEKLGITTASMNWHAKRLISLEIISMSKKGKFVTYQLSIPPKDVIKLMKNYHPKAWRMWSDRLSDLLLSLSGDLK